MVCLGLLVAVVAVSTVVVMAVRETRRRRAINAVNEALERRFHDANMCQPPCPIHAPSDHHMVGWPKEFRYYKGIFERTCPHNIGHPDPDSLAYAKLTRPERARTLPVHGCDGCCDEPDADDEGGPLSMADLA